MASPLPPTRRVVTTHSDRGQAIIARDSYIATEVLPHGVGALIWKSDTSPADVNSLDDKGWVEDAFVNNGSTVRIVDLPPGAVGKFHRSLSLDYIIIQKGAVVLKLDDGSRTTVNQGGFVVQQATMHGWSNESDGWARMLCIMLPANAPVVGGKELQWELSSLFEPQG